MLLQSTLIFLLLSKQAIVCADTSGENNENHYTEASLDVESTKNNKFEDCEETSENKVSGESDKLRISLFQLQLFNKQLYKDRRLHRVLSINYSDACHATVVRKISSTY